MQNPFYVQHLERLMNGQPEGHDNIVPQLYEWMTQAPRSSGCGFNHLHKPPMTLEDFKACLDLLVSKAEKAAMLEERSYHPDSPPFPDSVFHGSFGTVGES